MNAEDAVMAAKLGAGGVVVSNHGGRQLDSSAPPILVLRSVVLAVRETGTGCKVLVDGGVVRGRDVLKALSLGADGVCVGRAVLWGLWHSQLIRQQPI